MNTGAVDTGAMDAGADPAWDSRLRAAGLRSTAQRRAVLGALTELRHATVDQLADRVQQTLPDVSLSTVYRTLEVLDEAGLVTHTHLHHGSPTFHSVDEQPHVHLVCSRCQTVLEADLDVMLPVVQALRQAEGFTVDLAHLALHGLCAGCAGEPGPEGAAEAHPHDHDSDHASHNHADSHHPDAHTQTPTPTPGPSRTSTRAPDTRAREAPAHRARCHDRDHSRSPRPTRFPRRGRAVALR